MSGPASGTSGSRPSVTGIPAGLDADGAESEILPQEPPPRVARALSNFLIAFFLGVMAFAAFVPLPESVRCNFVLAPEGGSAAVTSPAAGVIDQVLVQLGQSVTKGQPLFSLVPYIAPGASPGELRARIDRLTAELDGALQVDQQLGRRHESRVADLRSDLLRARAASDAAQSRARTLASLTEQLERAVSEGAVSQRDMLSRRQEQQEAEYDLAEAQRSASAARRALDTEMMARNLEISEREALRSRLVGERAEAQAAMFELADASVEGESDAIAVFAPHDGVLTSLTAERPGLVVDRGQPLASVARTGARLRAEIAIPERGAARISQGQQVRLLLDAYPYTRHGIVKGLLTWVSPSAQGGTLAAFARLEDASVIVDDVRRPLLPGMSGEARIDIGSRTLLEYVFEPLRQLRETLAPGSAEAG